MRSDIFSAIIGQSQAKHFLEQSLRSGNPHHAFLFAGPHGCGRYTTSLAFAKALLGVDDDRADRIDRLVHPDLHIVEPEGPKYLLEQIHEVIAESQMHPVESDRRVFIFSDAARFNRESANAFLKTLEEPQAGNYFILITERIEDVLPTIVSRSMVVRFRRLQEDEVIKIVAPITESSPDEIRAAARRCANQIDITIMSLSDSGYRDIRQAVHEFTTGQRYSIKTAFETADKIKETIEDSIHGVKERHKLELAEIVDVYGDSRGSAGIKDRVKERHKRAERAFRQRLLSYTLDLLALEYRDLLAVSLGANDRLIHTEIADFAAAGDGLSLDSTVKAISMIDEIREMLQYNVSEQTAMENLLLGLGGLNAGSRRRNF